MNIQSECLKMSDVLIYAKIYFWILFLSLLNGPHLVGLK